MKTKKLLVVLLCLILVFSALAVVISADNQEVTTENEDKRINVWLIAGQSNAVGYGDINNYPDGYDAELFDRGVANVLYYGKGYGRDSEGFMPVRFSQGNGVQYSGAELGIASALANSGENHAIIKYANGDTQLSTLRNSDNASEDFATWTPPSAEQDSFSKTGALYDGFINTVREGIEMLVAQGYTPVVQGFWWMQGERDGNYGDMTAELYASYLKALIADMRADVGEIVGADLSATPFVYGRIYRHPAYAPNSAAGLAGVQGGQDEVNADTTLTNVSMLDTRTDLRDPKTGEHRDLVQQDGWHYDSLTQQMIGEAFVRRVNTLIGTPYTATESVKITKNEQLLYSVVVNYVPGSKTVVKFGSYELFSISDEGLKILNAQVNGTYGSGDYTVYACINPSQSMTMVEVKLPDGGVIRKGTNGRNSGSSVTLTSTSETRVKSVSLSYENLILNEYELVTTEPEAEGFGKYVYNLMNSFSNSTSDRHFAWTAKAEFIGSRTMAIKYRAKGAADWTVVDAYKLTEPTEYADEDYFKADVSGLVADTEYEYRIGVKDSTDEVNEWSKSYFFTTATGNEKEFTFIAVGDTQGITWGGTEVGNKGFMYAKAAFDEAFEEVNNPAFILHTGDVVENGLIEDQWNLYFKALGEAGASIPHFATPGNHDDDLATADQNFYFGMHFNHPDNGGNDELDPTVVAAINALDPSVKEHAAWVKLLIKYMDDTFYSYNYGDAHFIVYNSGAYSAQDELMMKAQRAWLKADLEANKDAKWTIVLSHQGVYNRYGGANDRNTLADILEGFDVDLVIQGHSHLVTRSYPMKNGEIVTKENPDVITKGDGTVYLLIGATALNHDRIDDKPNMENQAVMVSPTGTQPAYSVFNVTENSIEVTVKQVDGLILDKFKIVEEEEKEEEAGSSGDIVYNDDFHYFTYNDLSALGLWESIQKLNVTTNGYAYYPSVAPDYSSQRIKLTDGQGLQFNWFEFIGGKGNYNPNDTYVFECDVYIASLGDGKDNNPNSVSSSQCRAFFASFGGWYNQIGLDVGTNKTSENTQVGDGPKHQYAYTGNDTFHIKIELRGTTTYCTLTDSKGTTLTGTRTYNYYTNVETDLILQTMTFRCEDGESYMDNFTFKVFSNVETEYGTIPSNYADASKYPIVLFQDEVFKQAFLANQFTEATAAAQGLVDYNKGATAPAKILFRGDATATANAQNLGRALGTIDIDLNGYTLTQTDNSALFYLRTKSYDTPNNPTERKFTLNVYNGNIVIGTKLFNLGAVRNNSVSNVLVDADVKFENVTITAKRGNVFNNPYKSIIFYEDTASVSADSLDKEVNFNFQFDNCVFDLSRYHYDSTVFQMDHANDAETKVNIITVNVNGGEIILSPFTKNTKVYDKNAVSSITFGKGSDGKYLKLTVPTGLNATTLTNTDLSIGAETAYFKEYSKDALFTTYILEGTGSEVQGIYIEGYGVLPTEYADASKYPIVIFQGGEFKGAFNEFAAAMNAARALVDYDKTNPAKAQILFRGNATATSIGDQNMGRAIGVIDVNLNGYTLTQTYSDNVLFVLRIKDYAEAEQTLTLNIRNGKIITLAALFGISAQTSKTSASLNNADVNFDDVDITLKGQTNNDGPMFHTFGNSTSGLADPNVYFDFTFTDCTFDFSGLGKANYIFNMIHSSSSDTYITRHINLTLNGGEVIVGKGNGTGTNPYNSSLYALNATSSVTFGKGSDGQYLKITVPSDITTIIQNNLSISWAQFKTPFYTDAPIAYKNNELVSDGTWAEYVNPVTNGEWVTYTLQPEVYIEGYGTITPEYSDAAQYPIIVSQGGVFKKAFAADMFQHITGTTGDGAMEYARTLVDYDKTNPAPVQILLRGDATATMVGDQNLARAIGVIDVNLNGYTLTQTYNGVLFLLRVKDYSGADQTFTLKVRNGNIVLKNTMFGLSAQSNVANSKINNAVVNLENVNVTMSRSATDGINPLFGTSTGGNGNKSGDTDIDYDFNFTDCTFDFSGMKSVGCVFNMNNTVNDTVCNMKVTVEGGELKLSANIADPELYALNATSSLIFGKGKSGKYMSVTLPTSVAVPSLDDVVTTSEGIECVFVKAAVDGTTTSYTLYPEVMVGYTIKSSISLYSDLIFNIYIPKDSSIYAIIINNETISQAVLDESVTLIDAKAYYKISIPMAPNKAFESIAVTVTLNSGKTTVNANWTLSVLAYAKQVINDTATTETERTLMKDMLAYVASVYEYANCENAAEVRAAVNAVIGNYSGAALPNDFESITSLDGMGVASMHLSATPGFVFYPDTNEDGSLVYDAALYVFTQGGRTLECELLTDADGKKYFKVYNYAYGMCDDVEYEITGTGISGKYNIGSYYTFAKTLNSKTLTATVEWLWRYSMSAKAYRDSVIKN